MAKMQGIFRFEFQTIVDKTDKGTKRILFVAPISYITHTFAMSFSHAYIAVQTYTKTKNYATVQCHCAL